MNIPNILTIIRFLLVPVFGYYFYKEKFYIAVFLFLLASLTDILDGYIARKFNLITSWGKLADPLADKLMQITALVFLVIKQRIPSVVLIVVVAKEVFMVAGSILLYKKENFVVSANWYGKFATVLFNFAIVMMIFKAPFDYVFMILAVLATLFAFVMYIISFGRIRNVQQSK